MPADTMQTNDAPLTFHMDLSGVKKDLERARRLEPNISSMERLGCSLAGAAMTMFGVSRRSIPGALLSMAGVALLERGLSGHCSVYERIETDKAENSAGK